MKEKILSISFITILFSFSILGLILKDKDISSYERRKLTSSSSLKEDLLSNLDDYLTDQFPLRDFFISLNSTYDRYILNNKEDNNVYLENGYIIEKLYPLNEKEVSNFISKINYINNIYLKENRVFYTIIPDKSYFLDKNKYLKIDYDYLYNNLSNNLNIENIDIRSLLSLEDYYKTDIHIKQSSYFKIIKELSRHLEFEYQDMEYKEVKYSPFYGASYSKVPSFVKPDDLIYLSNDITDNVTVKHLEYGNKNVYEKDELKSADSYNVFLSGPSSLIEIDNPNFQTDKEIIIFRDSFGSSMSPLLIPYYKKITLVDLRYIHADLLPNYIDFKDKDILFLYSTLLVQDSHLLKVNMK